MYFVFVLECISEQKIEHKCQPTSYHLCFKRIQSSMYINDMKIYASISSLQFHLWDEFLTMKPFKNTVLECKSRFFMQYAYLSVQKSM